MSGLDGESNACYMRSIFGQASASGVPVLINSSNKLGTMTALKRFKENIRHDRYSEHRFCIETGHVSLERRLIRQARRSLDWSPKNRKGESRSGGSRQRRKALQRALRKGERDVAQRIFAKEHRKVQESESTVAKQEASAAKQDAAIAQQQNQIEALTAGLQKVSAQIEANKPAERTVMN